jgi:RNA polymerase sigma factor (sigma-70 family)
VADDCDSHPGSLTVRRAAAFISMMEAVTSQPFERFYLEHRDGVLAHLRRLLGAQAAEDAFQETFLRALRAYPRLKHADNLRAWVLTIATNVAVDGQRKLRPQVPDVPEIESHDQPLAHEELRELTKDLPPTERAAVFLRYGYDLSYQQIGAALGSSPDAARQAASSGIRRLRREEKR